MTLRLEKLDDRIVPAGDPFGDFFFGDSPFAGFTPIPDIGLDYGQFGAYSTAITDPFGAAALDPNFFNLLGANFAPALPDLTQTIGLINAYNGSSLYQFYDPFGTLGGLGFTTPGYSSFAAFGPDIMNFLAGGTQNLGLINPYSGLSLGNIYDPFGAFSGFTDTLYSQNLLGYAAGFNSNIFNAYNPALYNTGSFFNNSSVFTPNFFDTLGSNFTQTNELAAAQADAANAFRELQSLNAQIDSQGFWF